MTICSSRANLTLVVFLVLFTICDPDTCPKEEGGKGIDRQAVLLLQLPGDSITICHRGGGEEEAEEAFFTGCRSRTRGQGSGTIDLTETTMDVWVSSFSLVPSRADV